MCTFLGGEILFLVHICRGRYIPQGGEDMELIRKFCFVCFSLYFFLFALWCFELCLLYFLCCSHCIMFVLDMHTSLCYCSLLIACSDYHLLYYIIIVVISLWLFWGIVKLLICFTLCLLDRNLPVTLYLSFYYLLFLESLMCFVQVFQNTSIYVPSASQLLDLGVSEFCHCSQTHI